VDEVAALGGHQIGVSAMTTEEQKSQKEREEWVKRLREEREMWRQAAEQKYKKTEEPVI
jgi:hypothetical protein